ncbi:MAG: hypothetical protein LBG93_08205 [Treponema sp.]|jgi:hypothetical protein|nr:hypothetical protein [Treponema sp.]
MQPKALALFLILFAAVLPHVFSQEEEPPPIDIDWIDFVVPMHGPGDRTINMSVGTIFPTVFSIDGAPSPGYHNFRAVGGTASFSFNYFFTANIFLGGELAAMFLPTGGERMFFMVPFGIRAGYQFVFRRFEFPVGIMIGGAPHRMLDERYFGFIAQATASAFWRFNQDWSFGLNTVWWLVPQRPAPQDGVRYNALGNFLTVTLSARYHF